MPSDAPADAFSSLRGDAEAFLAAAAEAAYRSGAGLEPAAPLAPLYARFARLASPALHREVREAWADAPDDSERARLGALAEFTARHLLEAQVAGLRDRLAAVEAEMVLPVAGRAIPLREAEEAMKGEPDRAVRGRIAAAEAEALRTTRALRTDLLTRLYDGAAALDDGGMTGLRRAFRPAPLEKLAEHAEAILERTEGMYAETLAWALRRHLNVRLEGARYHDLLCLFRASWWDALFPAGRLVPAIEATLRALRLELTAAGRVRLDLTERPGKAPQPFAAAAKVPDRIYLVARATAGLEAYEAFWHEVGHALRWAHTDGNLPLERGRLGDAAVAELSASLLEGVAREAGWLRRFLGIGQPRDPLWMAHLRLLGHLRRCAATLQQELLLAGGANAEARVEAHRYRLGRAIRAEVPPEKALPEADPFLASANRLGGWMGAALLADALQERFDEDWYRNDRTGPFLRELWSQGLRPTLEVLLAQLGLGAPDPAPLLKRITRHLQ